MESAKRDQPSLNNFAPEILFEIFLNLSPDDIFSTALTNLKFHEILKREVFWKCKFEKDFPRAFRILNMDTNISWQGEYRKRYVIKFKARIDEKNTLKLGNVLLGEIFTLIEKGDVEGLTRKEALPQYMKEVGPKFAIIRWAQLINNQAVLDYLYELGIENSDYRPENSLDTVEARQSFKKYLANKNFILAIQCHQSENKLNELIEAGVDINPENSYEDPMIKAILSGHCDTVKLLLKNRYQIQKYDEGQLLKCAAEKNHFEIVKFLLDERINVNASNGNFVVGLPALRVAIENGYFNIVNLLLERGVKIALAPAYNQLQPLIYAAKSGYPEIVEMLLEKGVGVDSSSYLCTALMEAAYHGQTSTVLLLLEHGANVNFFSNGNEVSVTPLSRAVTGGHVEMTQLLLARGAVVDKKDLTALASLFLNAKIYGPLIKILEQDQFKKAELAIFMPHQEQILKCFIKQLEMDPLNKMMRLDKVLEKLNGLGMLFATPKSEVGFMFSLKRNKKTGEKITKSMQILAKLREEGEDPSLQKNQDHLKKKK